MRILVLTNEYPPNIYGGAGVHVGYLTREMRALNANDLSLQVMCFGKGDTPIRREQVVEVPGAGTLFENLEHARFLDTLYRNVVMTGSAEKADLIHCHTWYTYLAGCLLKQILGIPLVLTLHSLEPQRPWKKEQLGTAYHASAWLEKTALHNADGIIAVSEAMRRDVLSLYPVEPARVQVIYNGIDPDRYRCTRRPEVISRYGIDPQRPYVLFVGRITRQKGILHLVRALPQIDPGVQIVLCAGAPDTPEIGREMEALVAQARTGTQNPIHWITRMVPEDDLAALYGHAEAFICPSVYEPFGIINLEAMACGIPVVGSAVGGIPEVVVHEKTGLLVPFEPAGPSDPEPRRPEAFAGDLAQAVNDLLRRPERRTAMGLAARERVETVFSWRSIAEQTVKYYGEVIAAAGQTAG